MLNWMKRLEEYWGMSLNLKYVLIESIGLIVLLAAVYFLGTLLGG